MLWQLLQQTTPRVDKLVSHDRCNTALCLSGLTCSVSIKASVSLPFTYQQVPPSYYELYQSFQKHPLTVPCYPQNNLFTHLLPDMVVAFPFLHWVKKVVVTAIPRNDTNIKLRRFFGCFCPMDARNSDEGFDPQPTNSLALTYLYSHHVLFFIVSLPSFH